MNGLPAAIRADSSSWQSQKANYDFVDLLFDALDQKIVGAENRDRWMYWVSMLRSLQADAKLATMWGAMDVVMAKIAGTADPLKQKQLAKNEALPLRINMVQQAELAMQWKFNTTSTTGGLGAVANFQQMVLTNALAVRNCSKIGASNNGCHNYTAELKRYLNEMDKIPDSAMPVSSFRGVERCFVLSPRTSIETGRELIVRLIVLLRDNSVSKAKASLHYRSISTTRQSFQVMQFGAAIRGSVFFKALANQTADIEYYVNVTGATRPLLWPAGAPATPHTVIVV
eukprot:SAG31_NODE_1008_length_10407_cov_2.369131_7_plen_285_part_00